MDCASSGSGTRSRVDTAAYCRDIETYLCRKNDGHLIRIVGPSFEIVSRLNSIQFYVWTPRHLKDFVESQIYAQYPTVQIKEGPEDYSAVDIAGRTVYGTELGLTKDTVMPIKTFASFEVDPLAGITGASNYAKRSSIVAGRRQRAGIAVS